MLAWASSTASPATPASPFKFLQGVIRSEIPSWELHSYTLGRRDDTGKVLSVDSRVGCIYSVSIANYTKKTILIKRFRLNSSHKEIQKAGFIVKSAFIGVKIKPDNSYQIPKPFIIASWLKTQTQVPDKTAEAAALEKSGCKSLRGSVYLTYNDPKSFGVFSKTKRISKRKLKKIVIGNTEVNEPLEIKHN